MSFADEIDFARVAIYGDPGSGKTTAAAHLAQLGKVAYFLAEPGLKKAPMNRLGVPLDNIMPVRNVTSELMMNSFWSLKEKLEADPNAYAGAALDTASVFVDREVARIRKREYEKEVDRADARGEEYERTKQWTSRDYFGEMTVDVVEVLESFCDLPMHLVWTGHVRRDEDENTGNVTYGFGATPKVQEQVEYWFDILIHVERVDDSDWFIGHTVKHGDYKAKDRVGVLPAPIMAQPTMDRIVGYVNGDITEDNDVVQHDWLKQQKGNK